MSYGLSDAPLRLLSHRGNTLFRVDAAQATAGARGSSDGPRRYVLRLYGPQGTAPAIVRSELLWLATLHRETDLVVPVPVATRDGALLHEVTGPDVPEPRRCVLFEWVEGRFLDAGLTPAHLAHVGAYMAGLHQHAATFTPPADFLRPRWNWRATFGEPAAFERAAGAGALSAADQAVFHAAAARIAHGMATLAHDPQAHGLIHADLQQTNYLFHGRTARAIDFEDCCWSYYLFDMAITLFEVADRPQGAALRAGFFSGYSSVRPLPADYEAGIRLFTAIRLAKRVHYLAHAADPALRAAAPRWVAFAVGWLRRFLED
ncbi:MAG TPA: phosphotransferase [Chloroflexia bacterium]|nr:phosphotransferase [Chloroflexia bacterium]